jgi:hypothetical protein
MLSFACLCIIVCATLIQEEVQCSFARICFLLPLSVYFLRAVSAESPEGKEIFEGLRKLYREDSQVSAHNVADARNKAQHFLMEKTRLGSSKLLTNTYDKR